MKKISVLIPCYNEEENVVPISKAVIEMLGRDLPNYDYEILFIDNCSLDGTQELILGLCEQNKKIKAIFNIKNFGQFNSPFYGLLQTTGDCTVSLCCDFQDPVELIPQFVHEWEKGYKIVCAVKTTSLENPVIRAMRTVYYKLIKKISDVDIIEHFTGFGLYDKSFIEVLRGLDDTRPFIRGIVAELGGKRKEIEYQQPKRRAGKTHNNFFTLYDAAMLSFTSYTKIGLRLATFVGFGIGVLSGVIGLIYLILKLIMWQQFSAGMAPVLIGMFFLGAVQLVFIGILGEYILNINSRVIKRPLVVEEKRINFED
ncbi:MAG: hypothetical protein BWY46_00900 [Firmicutes bacterium ADurb.Bin300]|nr:MAG: hypothetical protein BWY46_00900 [Firmicutes bacterium ADurb.Bin300]HOD03256.1 glycosyltransferase family 2 protein [Clostridiales bacterium]